MGLLEACLHTATADETEKETLVQAVRSRLESLRARCQPTGDFRLLFLEELPSFLPRLRQISDEQAAIGHDVLARKLLTCLKRHEAVTQALAAQFEAILVDEFQDTSRVQAEILFLLSAVAAAASGWSAIPVNRSTRGAAHGERTFSG